MKPILQLLPNLLRLIALLLLLLLPVIDATTMPDTSDDDSAITLNPRIDHIQPISKKANRAFIVVYIVYIASLLVHIRTNNHTHRGL